MDWLRRLTNSAGITAEGAAAISSPFVQNGTLLVQGSDAGGNSTLTVANGFTNAGTITLQSANADWASNLTLTNGILTNAATGVLIVNAGSGGSRTVSAELTNQGTVTLNTLTAFPKPITNAGTFNLAASSLTIPQGSSFGNQATGTFHVQTDAILNVGSSTFTNAGTFIKSGTAGTATVTGFNGSFINTGLIDAQTGRLHFPDNVISSGAGNTFHAADGAAVTFRGDFFGLKFTDTTFSGPGVNLLDLGANQAPLNGAISTSNLEFRSGRLSGTSTITGTLNWTGGTIEGGPMAMTIASGSTLNLMGDAAKTLSGSSINNAGTTNWTGAGDLNLNNNAIFNNTGVFNVQTDASLVQIGGGTSTFDNQGTLTKSVTGGTTTVQLVNFKNSGAVDVQTGTLDFPQIGTNTLTASGAGNRFRADAGAAVTFGVWSSTFTDTDFAGPRHTF